MRAVIITWQPVAVGTTSTSMRGGGRAESRSGQAGRHMPAVTSVDPQSQPNGHAILRTKLNGSVQVVGRSPTFLRTASASV